MTVLIVDDSRIMRLKLKSLVGATGLPVGEILEAGHGGEAMTLLSERSVDAIFTDINMPVMDGRELIRQMHEKQVAANAVKVVCTTEDLAGLKEDLVRYGITLYIEKPFDPEAVKRVLMHVGKTAA